MRKISLAWWMGCASVIACATSQTSEDLCDPRDPECGIFVGDGDGDGDDGGLAGNAASGSAGEDNGGSGGNTAGAGGSGGTAGEDNGGDAGEDNGGAAGDGGAAGEDNGGAGAGGTSGASGNGGTGGAPECTVATQAVDCNDDEVCTDDVCVDGECDTTNNTAPCADETPAEPCTDDVCSGGTCTHPNNTDACTPDADSCTMDVCAGGACTHPAIGGCTVNSVVIQTNRDGGSHYVTVDAANGNLLVWNIAATAGAAAVFQAIPVTGTQFKLRAPNNNYVVVGANDDLFATEAAEANAAVIDMAPCAYSNGVASNCAPNCVGLQVVTGDDDAANFISSHDAAPPGSQMRVFRSNCGNTATTWESFRVIVQ